MKKIKFRGKNKKSGKWLYGDLVRNIRGEAAIVPPLGSDSKVDFEEFGVDENTVGRLIYSQKWADGSVHEVYTDDILRFTNIEGKDFLRLVDGDGFVFVEDDDCWYPVGCLTEDDYSWSVAGHNFDNPDLLKGTGHEQRKVQ